MPFLVLLSALIVSVVGDGFAIYVLDWNALATLLVTGGLWLLGLGVYIGDEDLVFGAFEAIIEGLSSLGD